MHHFVVTIFCWFWKSAPPVSQRGNGAFVVLETPLFPMETFAVTTDIAIQIYTVTTHRARGKPRREIGGVLRAGQFTFLEGRSLPKPSFTECVALLQ